MGKETKIREIDPIEKLLGSIYVSKRNFLKLILESTVIGATSAYGVTTFKDLVIYSLKYIELQNNKNPEDPICQFLNKDKLTPSNQEDPTSLEMRYALSKINSYPDIEVIKFFDPNQVNVSQTEFSPKDNISNVTRSFFSITFPNIAEILKFLHKTYDIKAILGSDYHGQFTPAMFLSNITPVEIRSLNEDLNKSSRITHWPIFIDPNIGQYVFIEQRNSQENPPYTIKTWELVEATSICRNFPKGIKALKGLPPVFFGFGIAPGTMPLEKYPDFKQWLIK